MQITYIQVSGRPEALVLPNEREEVIPGVRWGNPAEFFTPAFWHVHGRQHLLLGTFDDLRLGKSLVEEVAACLLGGFGMPAELGLAAFGKLQDRGLLKAGVGFEVLLAALEEPLVVDGRSRRYRFARQKARYLSGCLSELSGLEEPASDTELRDRLVALPGLGPKTASWVVRNYRRSNRVAVLDVHIVRAGRLMGFFGATDAPERNYADMEDRYLRFADAIDIPGRVLDALIWAYMRILTGTSERSIAASTGDYRRPERLVA